MEAFMNCGLAPTTVTIFIDFSLFPVIMQLSGYNHTVFSGIPFLAATICTDGVFLPRRVGFT